MTVDPLDVNSLPSDPREMALRLLGMTVSELKQIDEKVISGHNFVGGVKVNVNKIVNDVIDMPVVKENKQQVDIPTQPIIQTQSPVVQQSIQAMDTSQASTAPSNLVPIDDNQLEFDFYRKIKPEDLEYQLKLISTNLQEINSKIDKLFDTITKKNFLDVDGTSSQ